jgi:hypothetical protein
MNPYEKACERFNTAVRNYSIAKAKAEEMVAEADREWMAAEANVRQYESRPGIPLPQYREVVQA